LTAVTAGFNPTETAIGVSTVASLRPVWVFNDPNVGESRLAVSGGRVFASAPLGPITGSPPNLVFPPPPLQVLDDQTGTVDWTAGSRVVVSCGDIGEFPHDGLLSQPSKLDRALPKLRRVGSGHRNILPETTIVASGSMSANPGKLNAPTPGRRDDRHPGNHRRSPPAAPLGDGNTTPPTYAEQPRLLNDRALQADSPTARPLLTRPRPFRQYVIAWIELARKNGKSELATSRRLQLISLELSAPIVSARARAASALSSSPSSIGRS
jgi:hypothetical protein